MQNVPPGDRRGAACCASINIVHQAYAYNISYCLLGKSVSTVKVSYSKTTRTLTSFL